MSAFKPGVGDPLGNFDNMYCDGKPNWNLQTKSRVNGPTNTLGNNLTVQQPQENPYKKRFPQQYQWSRQEEQRGRKHYDSHLQLSEKEVVQRGCGIPQHIRSGNEVPDKKTGRGPAPSFDKRIDPKNGGMWEPVRREYPKVSRIEHQGGCKIVDKPVKPETLVDIWPATISVRDKFLPGGLKMFEGKRATNKEAFPGAMGYEQPRMVDDRGNKIDYSSVQYGGPFGYKLMHANEPMHLAQGVSASWKVDRTAKYEDVSRMPSPANSAALRGMIVGGDMSASTASKPHIPAIHLTATGGVGGSRRGSAAVSQLGGSLRDLFERDQVMSRGTKKEPVAYLLKNKAQYEQPLVSSTNWTFLGSYRP